MLSSRASSQEGKLLAHLIEQRGNAAVMSQKPNAKPASWIEGKGAIDDPNDRYDGEEQCCQGRD